LAHLQEGELRWKGGRATHVIVNLARAVGGFDERLVVGEGEPLGLVLQVCQLFGEPTGLSICKAISATDEQLTQLIRRQVVDFADILEEVFIDLERIFVHFAKFLCENKRGQPVETCRADRPTF